MITLSEFKKAYSKAIQEGYAAIFAGAGLSKASGFVNWKELLNDLAQEIQLDVEKEPDLVEVAQYYCNEKRSRNEINEKILKRISCLLCLSNQIPCNWIAGYTRFLFFCKIPISLTLLHMI